MNVRMCAIALAACVAAGGCQQNPQTQFWLENMRAERLALEDAYYELQYEYDLAVEELEAARRETETLRQRQGDESGVRPRIELPGETGNAPGTEVPPFGYGDGIEPMSMTPSDATSITAHNASSSPLPIPDGQGEQFTEAFSSVPEEIDLAEPLDMRVTHIVINPYLTTGHDFDRKPGDDGLSIVIEPRNADDRFVPKAGAISIVVLDPALRHEGRQAAEVARWEFDAARVESRLKTRVIRGRGINLKLPWPNDHPQNTHLQVFVRYETDEGVKLEADATVEIALSGQFSSRWTPKGPGSQSGVVLSSHAQPAGPQRIEGSYAAALVSAEDEKRKTVSPSESEGRNAPANAEQSSTDANTNPPQLPKWQPFR